MKKRLPNKKCELCGVEFTPRMKNQRFCQNPHPMSCVECKKDCPQRPRVGRFEYSCGSKECIVALKKKTNLKKYGVEYAIQSKELQDKMKQTNLEKYGVEYIVQSKEFQEKAKNTMIERYGVENPLQSKEIQEKKKQTTLERYGVEHTFQSKEIQEKRKQTNLERYGVESASQSKVIQDKMKQTTLERYGVEYAGQIKEAKEKIKQTNLKKYGVEHTLQLKHVREKGKQTNLKKYGVEYATQLKEVQEKGKQTKLERGFLRVSDEDFIETVENWKATHGRKPTLTELTNHWGYNSASAVSHKVSQFELSHFVNKKDSYLELKAKDFLDEFEFNYIRNDRQQIKPKELDFYLSDYNVAIEVNDFFTHNSTYCQWGVEPKSKDYHINKTKLCKDKGIKLIHAWEHHITDESKFKILKNTILQACGKLKEVNADNTTVEMRPAIEIKNFFNENHIDGYKDAQDCYSLICNKTGEILMAYSLNISDNTAEIVQYATKLGYSITDGDSKLWRHIINNTNYNSITYDVNLDMHPNNPINFSNVELISEHLELKYYLEKEKKVLPSEHFKKDEIEELIQQKKVWEVWDAGVQSYIWKR